MNNNQDHIDDFMYRTFGYPPLRKAPTESGLSPEQHDALMRRFPRAATPAPPPATHEPATHEGLGFQNEADREGTPMRSIRVDGQPAITHRYGHGPKADNGPDILRQNEEAKEVKQGLAAEHVRQGTLTNGTEFLNLGSLAMHQANLIAKEYAKWHESGGGPLPDLSKYENPVARRKDGTKWDYRQTADRLTRLHQRARDYDALHDDEHRGALRVSSNGNLQVLDPKYIWDHIHEGVSTPRIAGRDTVRTIFPDELKRTGLRPHQYPYQARSLVSLGLHHQKLSRLHAEGADDDGSPT